MTNPQPCLIRLLEELIRTRDGRGAETSALAERCALGEDQLFGALRLLAGAGVPLRLSARGWGLTPSYFEPAAGMDAMEFALALNAAGEASRLGLPGAAGADRIGETVSRRATAEYLRRAGRLRRTLEAGDVPAAPSAETGLLRSLCGAVQSKCRIRLLYGARKNARPAWLETSPAGLAFRRGFWRLVGYCHKRGEIREFKHGGILETGASNRPYSAGGRFQLDPYLIHTWNILGGEPREVLIRFDRDAFPADLEQMVPGAWIWKRGGYTHARILVDGLDGIGEWAMALGDRAEVLEPLELRNELGIRAAKMSLKYKQGTAASANKKAKVIQLFKSN